MNPLLISSIGSFVIIALSYWFMPYATPKTVVFGVRVPPDRENDGQISDLRRSYHITILAGSVVIFLSSIVVPAYYGIYFASLVSIFVEIVFAYLVYYWTNRRLEHIKAEQGWYVDLKQAVGAMYKDEDLRRKGWETGLFMLPSLVIIAVTLYVGIVTYPSLPNPLPTHFNASGQPNGYATKSVGIAFLTVFIEIGITAMIFLIGFAISRTRQEIDVSRPLETMIQQEKFRHYTISALFLFQALINVTMMFASFSVWEIMSARYTIAFTLIPVLAGAALLVLVMMNIGQMGSRLDVKVKEGPTGVVNRNDDQYWKGGAIYYNKNDSAILVGKRFGVGWTFNFAHPVTWLVMGAIILTAIIPPLLALHVI